MEAIYSSKEFYLRLRVYPGTAVFVTCPSRINPINTLLLLGLATFGLNINCA
jgi:hypothetical protein